MCTPAPVVLAFGRDVADRYGIPTTYNQPGPGGVFLGSVGDQDHATRTSGHNCAPMQESPVNGVGYAGQYAHAWDARPVSKTVGERMAVETLADRRVRYVIYDNVGRKPNGERWHTDHPTFHVSFLPGTHADIAPFFTHQQEDDIVTPEQMDRLENVAQNQGIKTRKMMARLYRAEAKANRRLSAAEVDDIVAAIEAEAD